MKKIFLLIIFILTTTCFISAQENYTDSTNPVVSEQEKSNAQNFIGSVDEIVRELKNSSVGKASDMFASFTTLLICIGAVIIIITKTMKAMHKGEVIDLNSILLPFILALVVSAYKPLTHSVDWCVQGFDAIMAGMSYSTLDEIEIKREKKEMILKEINKKIDALKGQPGSNAIIRFFQKQVNNLVKWKDQLVSTMLSTLLFCASFITRILGATLNLILYTLGPIVIAMSAIPIFSDGWKNWLSKYIWVQLFTPVARVISWVLQCIENLVLQQDIVRCQNILDNFEQYGGISVDSNFSGGVAYTGFMAVGIILYMAVPSIASWIINTSGGGIMTAMNAMGTMMMQQGLTGGSKALGAGGDAISGMGGMAGRMAGKTAAGQAIITGTEKIAQKLRDVGILKDKI